MCQKCGQPKCCCKTQKIIVAGPSGRNGRPGKQGQSVPTVLLKVKDNSTTVNDVQELRFTDPNFSVTSPGSGVAVVHYNNPAPSTVWNDVQNLDWYVGGGVASFKPQYTIEGNRITFRGLLFLPLDFDFSLINVTNGSDYLTVPSAVLHDASLSVISNANNNNGTPQGRAMTSNISTKKNLASQYIPVGRDIQFNNVPCYRRYDNGKVGMFRSYVNIRIASTASPYLVSSVIPSGCILVFSPFNEEYDGSGNAPLGNDPLALSISRITNGVHAVDYVASKDDQPFTVGDSGNANPFDLNAHNITSLGGFIINLEGLSGFLN